MSNIDKAIDMLVEGQIPVQDLNAHVLQAIQFVVGGTTLWSNDRNHEVHAYQKYGTLNMQVANVMQDGDKFDIVVHHSVRRKVNQERTPNSYNKQDWDDWDTRNPVQNIVAVDSEIGSPLLKFSGRVEGKKPGMQKVDRQGLFPYPTDRADMVPIADWDNLDTPYEVAEYIKNSIDRFYRPDGGEDDVEDDTPTPSPGLSSPSPSNVPVPVAVG